MLLTVTIWTASADCDGGTQGESFATEREAEDWILNLLDDDASRETLDEFIADNPESNLWDFVEDHRANDLDTFNIDSKEIAIAVPATLLPRPRIVVAIEGGLVQGASANAPVELCVVDYDTEGREDADIIAIPQSGSDKTEGAGAHVAAVDLDPEWTDQVFAVVRKHWQEDDGCGQCEGTGTIQGGQSGDGDDEPCPVCDATGAAADDDELTELTVGYLVRDALDLLDQVEATEVNDKRPQLVTFRTVDGNEWRAAVSREV
jgi:hypothetical protein